ncbi:MAG TPA: DUF4040 domain-containing protein, partial [Trueperaceae bacterium]|nr:DUF4040 domain-containing protein [Trueperaceae bacterium]
MLHCLEVFLQLLSPFMPFLSEEIWQMLPGRSGESITLGPWPEADAAMIDDEVEARSLLKREAVTAVRNLRKAYAVPARAGVAVVAVLGPEAPRFHLELWHGFTPAFMLSLVAMALGASLYFALYRRLANREARERPWAGRARARRIFDGAMTGLFAGAGFITRLAGTVRLQPQLFLIVLAAVVAGAAPFVYHAVTQAGAGLTLGTRPLTPVSLPFVVVWAFGIASATGAAILAKFHRLAALILTGGAGLAVCLTFVWLSAPDLAVTQLLVEIVTTVLLLLGLRWLPARVATKEDRERARALVVARRGRDLVLALIAGGGMATLALAAMTRPRVGGIAGFFNANALEGGGGR